MPRPSADRQSVSEFIRGGDAFALDEDDKFYFRFRRLLMVIQDREAKREPVQPRIAKGHSRISGICS